MPAPLRFKATKWPARREFLARESTNQNVRFRYLFWFYRREILYKTMSLSKKIIISLDATRLIIISLKDFEW